MKFTILAKTKIGENRNLVISQREDGKLSIAQQIEAYSDGQVIKFFVKNAIQTDLEGLEKIEAIANEAIKKLKDNVN